MGMTEQEAIKWLECIVYEQSPRTQKAMLNGIKALEKQIAKKPLLRLCNNCQEESCISCNRYIDRCPSCNGDLYKESGLPYKHCPDCGQKLDWGNEDAE